MKIFRSLKPLQQALRQIRREKTSIGFVPTMGYLHAGHAALLHKARRQNSVVVLSIFVNPHQFGPSEDFSRYPRDFKKDEKLAKKENVDIIFYPSEKIMYPTEILTSVAVSRLSQTLCGAFRPGHFTGVATVVAKLLNIVQPDVMYLGQKDAQQVAVLKKMVLDLNFPTHISVLPTIREKDGLALSSRNSYLTLQERQLAPMIYQALKSAKALIDKGERNTQKINQFIRQTITQAFPAKFDYVECVDAQQLQPLSQLRGQILIAVALWLGKTRLIDNVKVTVRS